MRVITSRLSCYQFNGRCQYNTAMCGSASPVITMNRSDCGSRHHNHKHERGSPINTTLEVCRYLYHCHTQPLASSLMQSGVESFSLHQPQKESSSLIRLPTRGLYIVGCVSKRTAVLPACLSMVRVKEFNEWMECIICINFFFPIFYFTHCKEIPSTSLSPAYKNYQMSSLKFYDEYTGIMGLHKNTRYMQMHVSLHTFRLCWWIWCHNVWELGALLLDMPLAVHVVSSRKQDGVAVSGSVFCVKRLS